MVSHRIDIFYLLDSSSKLTRIISYFQTRGHEKLITTFFTRYFPSPSICHENLRFCWKLLRTIIYFLELEKLIITFFRKKMKKCEFVNIDIYWKIYRYIERNISIYHCHSYLRLNAAKNINCIKNMIQFEDNMREKKEECSSQV